MVILANYCISLWFSGADVGALDSRKYTPLMVAAAWNNDALLREMMDKDMAAVEKLSFNAAYACDKRRLNFLKVSQSCPVLLYHSLPLSTSIFRSMVSFLCLF